MNLSSAKAKVKKSQNSLQYAKQKGWTTVNYPLITFNQIKYSGKLSAEDLEKFEIWFNNLK